MPVYKAHIESLETAFLDTLRTVPGLGKIQIVSSSSQSNLMDYGADIDVIAELYGFQALLKTPSKEAWTVFVQTRASGDPRLIRESCARLNEIRRSRPDPDRCYLVVGATYISKRASEICNEMNVGYFDLSGNCRFAFDSIFIERQVLENKHVEKRPLRSIFSAKSSRVVRLLLEEPEKSWHVQDIAKQADISLGLASKVKQKLLNLDFATMVGDGLKPRDAEALLLAWSREYSYKDNEILECYAPGGMNENEGRLYQYCQGHNISNALTLFSAANRVAPFVRGLSQSAMYVDGNLNTVAAGLEWKSVPSGSNFLLLKPFDEFIMRNEQTSDKWLYSVVSDIQLYLDLASHRGRGAEAAEFLLEQRIRPKWKAGRSAIA